MGAFHCCRLTRRFPWREQPADFDFDEVGVVHNRLMNIWLSAKCRKYVDPDAAAAGCG